MAMRHLSLLSAGFFLAAQVWAQSPANDRDRLNRIEQSLKADVPRVLCLNEAIATGAQPTEKAFATAAANGFRSVLSLRTADEGLNLARERSAVESSGLSYFNIPVLSVAPRAEQADQFIRLVKEPANHPMLITCASANRVGAFMMIFRVIEQGWSEEQALKEARNIGLRSDNLIEFARQYLARRRQ